MKDMKDMMDMMDMMNKKDKKDMKDMKDMNNMNFMSVGYAYVPIQKFENLYDVDEALKKGTIFKDLFLPMDVYGTKKGVMDV